MTLSGRLGSWWSYRKPSSAKQLIVSLISRWNFQVFLGNQVSRSVSWRTVFPKDPYLRHRSSTYTSVTSLPPTVSLQFEYADDWTLATNSKTFSHLERTLSLDIEHLNEYFDYWKLRLNTKKTVSTCFHLDNKQAARKLKVSLAGDVLVHDFAPKYLGVTLDRSFTYRKHTENVRDKVKSRYNIISKLAVTDWGAPAPLLRTSAIALVYSFAEYCVPVWGRCAHVQHVDTQLNIAMRTVSGPLRPTNTNWLPVPSNIEPRQIRRDRATLQEYKKAQQLTERVPIKEILREPPKSRLRSRRHFVTEAARLASLNQTEQETWKQSWIEGVPPGHDVVKYPTCAQPGFTLPIRQFVTLNRLRCGQARCAESLYRWGVIAWPACPCGESHQSTRHIVEECPLTAFRVLTQWNGYRNCLWNCESNNEQQPHTLSPPNSASHTLLYPDIRRNKQSLALSRRAEADDQHTLHNIVTASTPGRKRLQSRHPFSEHAKQLTSDAHGKTNRAWAEGTWETRWDTTRCRLRTFIQTPSNKHIRHDLARYSLVRLNRIRTGYGRFNANMNQMGLSPSASCDCGATDETAQHIASECPLRRCKGDLVVLDLTARNWLHGLQCDV